MRIDQITMIVAVLLTVGISSIDAVEECELLVRIEGPTNAEGLVVAMS